MLQIKDLKTLRKLKTNNKINEIALVEETRTLYKWDGESWNIHKPEGGINVSLYELNQSAMTAAPAMEIGAIEAAKQKIKDYVDNIPYGVYYMLLGREQNYYTIFKTKSAFDPSDYKPIEDEVIECLQAQGTIKDISEVDNGVEFWVTIDNNSYVYYLFNYDKGVIICR